MEEEDPGKVQKQQYLRDNILEKNYKIEEFVAYMQSTKGNYHKCM